MNIIPNLSSLAILESGEGLHYISDSEGANAMNNFYVYTHSRQSDGAVFYVGKGQDVRAYKRSHRNPFWKNVVAKHGLVVTIVQSGLTEAEAFKSEMAMIAELRAAGIKLVNMTDGGEGKTGYTYVMPEERKKKIGDAQRGIPKPPERVAKVAAALRGRKMNLSQERRESLRKQMTGNKFRLGIAHSEEHKLALSEKVRGFKKTPEAIERTAAAHRGKPKPVAQRAKISAKLKGISTGPKSESTKAKMSSYASNRSPEHRENLGKAFRGKKLSAEHVEKIAASKRGKPNPKVAAYWAGRRVEKQAAAACLLANLSPSAAATGRTGD